MIKWLINWLRNRRCMKFRKRNYPVTIKRFPKQDMVLVRNLGTHQHSGWLISIDNAVAEWGKAVIDNLETYDG